MKKYFWAFLLIWAVYGCSDSGSKNSKVETPTKQLVKAPTFNADSAYHFVQTQVDFGPRIPNSEAHGKAAEYFVNEFKSFGAEVVVQEFDDQTYDGTRVSLKNIIASFNPEKKKRILLAAHWDTRPFSDKDPEKPNSKFDGADDGASGVGVLLEVARVIGLNKTLNIGVDIILFDGEDWGEHRNLSSVTPTGGKDSWWCLGSQHWSKNKHVQNYSAFFGVLLDMVGSENATFYQDAISKNNAQRVLDKVWGIAGQLGHGRFFVNKPGIELTDDHLYINRDARIPMIDIIDLRNGNDFAPEHHKQIDNMSAINKNTLKAVGEVLLSVLYNE